MKLARTELGNVYKHDPKSSNIMIKKSRDHAQNLELKFLLSVFLRVLFYCSFISGW